MITAGGDSTPVSHPQTREDAIVVVEGLIGACAARL
jgi:hypothetical protein